MPSIVLKILDAFSGRKRITELGRQQAVGPSQPVATTAEDCSDDAGVEWFIPGVHGTPGSDRDNWRTYGG